MKEQLISFETAKLAKEKGFFDKNVYSEVRLSQSYYYDDKGILHTIKEVFYNNTDYDLKNCFNAPTQSLLQKWLREIHNIHVWCEHQHKDLQNIYGYRINGDVETSPLTYNTWSYEESLEAGLQEALKLIK